MRKAISFIAGVLFLLVMLPLAAEEGPIDTYGAQAIVRGDYDENPFLQQQEEEDPAAKNSRLRRFLFSDGSPIELSAIWYAQDKYKAILNGKIIEEGDVVDGGLMMVTKIRREEIFMKDFLGKEYRIGMNKIAGTEVGEVPLSDKYDDDDDDDDRGDYED